MHSAVRRVDADPAVDSHYEQLREARSILRHEADALVGLADRLDASFCAAVETICNCAGCVIVTGMGKAGLIGRKISATLASTGARSHFVHPAEALHGDLGAIHADDVVLALSNSGETDEVRRLTEHVRQRRIPVIAFTADEHSTLAGNADVALTLGRLREAGINGLAPSTSTTAMLALGDALALVVSRAKGFTARDFAAFHPGGSLGDRLRPVSEIMRKSAELRIAPQTATVREANAAGRPERGTIPIAVGLRRTGAVMLVDAEGRLSGLFTDSDLARLLEHRRDDQIDRPVEDVMTTNPLTIHQDALLTDVVDVMSGRKVSELPVVDSEGRPVGLIDITDVIGLLPQEAAA